ncbi:uncharacterized protein LOC123652264 [Pipistrellus kuhlii]|uniref:uncharacterized protein LOC123652264 n=1 Tax=Pipistrellus kuhlii TaxID=59472 RepID=UPI001E271EAD|nr:uncharacterized protein LOC123652264 [Pipistrellus kuhlii]
MPRSAGGPPAARPRGRSAGAEGEAWARGPCLSELDCVQLHPQRRCPRLAYVAARWAQSRAHTPASADGRGWRAGPDCCCGEGHPPGGGLAWNGESFRRPALLTCCWPTAHRHGGGGLAWRWETRPAEEGGAPPEAQPHAEGGSHGPDQVGQTLMLKTEGEPSLFQAQPWTRHSQSSPPAPRGTASASCSLEVKQCQLLEKAPFPGSEPGSAAQLQDAALA